MFQWQSASSLKKIIANTSQFSGIIDSGIAPQSHSIQFFLECYQGIDLRCY